MKQRDKILQGDLSLEAVTLQLGLCCVLSDVTIHLPLDGVILLRGRNGVGKTSFLRSLLGLITPQKGKVTLWGKPPQQARSFIGMMSQKVGDAAPMLPVMSHVMASIDGPRWGFSLSSKRRQQAWALLQLVGAEGLAQQPLGVLSGGERQRVALAQALAGTPSLLILDEPLAALDSIARQEILTLLQHLHEQLGLVVMMTLHEEVKVEKYFAPLREIWLEDGKFRA